MPANYETETECMPITGSRPLLARWMGKAGVDIALSATAPVASVPAIVIPVAQTAHGFAVGDVVRIASGLTLLSADSFNRADNAISLGSTDGAGSFDPQAWDTAWGISSNQAYRAGGVSVTVLELGTADVDLTVLLAVSVGSGAGIVFRYSDALTMWRLWGTTTAGHLYKYSGGSPTPVGATLAAFNSGDTLRVVANGSTITCYQNGTQIITATDSYNASATKHGLHALDPLTRFDNFSASSLVATYVKAQANNTANAESVGVVSRVVDANHFEFTQVGRITGLSGLTAGSPYYLSASSAGAITTTAPSTSGQVSKPILIPDTTTSALVLNYRGLVIP